MRKQNKKALSDLIATVLIVGIAIAAFGIVYSYIIPIIRGGIETSKMCSEVQLSIDSTQGFTNYEGFKANVMVSRGGKGSADSLTALQIKVTDTTGNSKTEEQSSVPGLNEDKTYQIDLIDKTPYSAAVAAVVMVGNKKVYCDLSPEVYLEAKA